MKTKFILALMPGLLLALAACEDKQDPENNGNNHQNEQETTPSFDGAKGTVGGHDWVNLGLPSGTLWATCNVGAEKPEEYGDYFAWGETSPKSNYEWGTYKYGADHDQLTKYCENSEFGKDGFTDSKTILEDSDDAATVNWGDNWRMPTVTEVRELFHNCTSVWTTQEGVHGRVFVGPNGNQIFLPAAGECSGGNHLNEEEYGYYWSSTLTDYGTSFHASGLSFFSNTPARVDSERCKGFPVRPVVKR